MTRQVLSWYVAAEKELALIEKEIMQYGAVTDTVISSMTEFPYIKQNIVVRGPSVDDKLIRLLCEKRQRLKVLRVEVEQFLAGIDDPFISAAIRMRYIKGKSWQRVAMYMGGWYTANNVRMAVERYLKKTESGICC